MRLLHRFLPFLSVTMLALSAAAQNTTTTITLQHLIANGVAVANAKVCATPADAQGNTISVSSSGWGLVLKDHPFCASVVNGALPAGLPVPDASHTTAAAAIRYNVLIQVQNANGIASGPAILLTAVPNVSGTTFPLDSYTPLVSVSIPPSGLIYTSGVPSSCTSPSIVIDQLTPAAYMCQDGSLVPLAIATNAVHADTADTATTATTAGYATNAGTANSATNATNATNADHASTADTATTATTATTAISATTAATATNATSATSANTATNLTGSVTAISFTADADCTVLTATNCTLSPNAPYNGTYVATSTVVLSSMRNLIVPQSPGRQYQIKNLTSGAQDLCAGTSPQNCVHVPYGQTVALDSDSATYTHTADPLARSQRPEHGQIARQLYSKLFALESTGTGSINWMTVGDSVGDFPTRRLLQKLIFRYGLAGVYSFGTGGGTLFGYAPAQQSFPTGALYYGANNQADVGLGFNGSGDWVPALSSTLDPTTSPFERIHQLGATGGTGTVTFFVRQPGPSGVANTLSNFAASTVLVVCAQIPSGGTLNITADFGNSTFVSIGSLSCSGTLPNTAVFKRTDLAGVQQLRLTNSGGLVDVVGVGLDNPNATGIRLIGTAAGSSDIGALMGGPATPMLSTLLPLLPTIDVATVHYKDGTPINGQSFGYWNSALEDLLEPYGTGYNSSTFTAPIDFLLIGTYPESLNGTQYSIDQNLSMRAVALAHPNNYYFDGQNITLSPADALGRGWCVGGDCPLHYGPTGQGIMSDQFWSDLDIDSYGTTEAKTAAFVGPGTITSPSRSYISARQVGWSYDQLNQTDNHTGSIQQLGPLIVSTVNPASYATTVTPIGAGNTTYTYRVCATDNQHQFYCEPDVSITNGNASLSTTNFNVIDWQPMPGMTNYHVFRVSTTGGLAAGELGTGNSPQSSGYVDQGQTVSGGLVYASNDMPYLTLCGLNFANCAIIKSTGAANGNLTIAPNGNGTLVLPSTVALDRQGIATSTANVKSSVAQFNAYGWNGSGSILYQWNIQHNLNPSGMVNTDLMEVTPPTNLPAGVSPVLSFDAPGTATPSASYNSVELRQDASCWNSGTSLTGTDTFFVQAVETSNSGSYQLVHQGGCNGSGNYAVRFPTVDSTLATTANLVWMTPSQFSSTATTSLSSTSQNNFVTANCDSAGSCTLTLPAPTTTPQTNGAPTQAWTITNTGSVVSITIGGTIGNVVSPSSSYALAPGASALFTSDGAAYRVQTGSSSGGAGTSTGTGINYYWTQSATGCSLGVSAGDSCTATINLPGAMPDASYQLLCVASSPALPAMAVSVTTVPFPTASGASISVEIANANTVGGSGSATPALMCNAHHN